MSDSQQEVRLTGRTISPGLVIGKAFIYREMESLAGAEPIEAHQIEEELRRMERALKTVAGDLRISAQRIEGDTHTKLGAIFEAHAAMLQDPGLQREMRALVEEELLSAAQAARRVFRRWERKFQEMTELSHQQHAHDVADLSPRLLRELAGVKTTSLEKMPPGRVLVARRLLPSDTVALPRQAVAGIVVEFGGPGSHAALLAEALGIPTVAQIFHATEQIGEDDVLLVDGFRGQVVVRPGPAARARYREELRGAQVRHAQMLRLAGQPARTLDGTAVEVLANVGGREDVIVAAENGADGVGLYRMEQFYLARNIPPTVAELLAELRAVFAPMRGKPVTVRLLDLGGDKPVPFLKLPREDNPLLGQRGVRLLLRYPDLLETQFEALCAFSQEHDLRILVPMVTLATEMASLRSRLTPMAKAAGCERVPPLGAMIETPAAALSVAEIIGQSDFLSIGTNDLTQFTMAAGRENPLVSDYFCEEHPAVLRLLRIIVEEAGRTPVALCGELARQVETLPALLKLGIRVLSVAPPLVPAVKQAIRQIVL